MAQLGNVDDGAWSPSSAIFSRTSDNVLQRKSATFSGASPCSRLFLRSKRSISDQGVPVLRFGRSVMVPASGSPAGIRVFLGGFVPDPSQPGELLFAAATRLVLSPL